jgi:hypothetical protein
VMPAGEHTPSLASTMAPMEIMSLNVYLVLNLLSFPNALF